MKGFRTTKQRDVKSGGRKSRTDVRRTNGKKEVSKLKEGFKIDRVGGDA